MIKGREGPPAQLPLTWPHRPATGRGDFVVGKSNRAAVALIDGWPRWPERGVFLFGPAGSGKSHLVEIWCQVTSARALATPSASASGARYGATALRSDSSPSSASKPRASANPDTSGWPSLPTRTSWCTMRP